MGAVMLALPIVIVVLLVLRERALYRENYRKPVR